MSWVQLATGEAPPWLAEVAGLVVGAATEVGVILLLFTIGLAFPDDLRLEPAGTPA